VKDTQAVFQNLQFLSSDITIATATSQFFSIFFI